MYDLIEYSDEPYEFEDDNELDEDLAEMEDYFVDDEGVLQEIDFRELTGEHRNDRY